MVIQDGVMDELVEQKKAQSANAVSSVFIAWRNGMFGDENFRYAVQKLGLADNKYTRSGADKVSEKEIDEILDDTEEIISKTFPEE